MQRPTGMRCAPGPSCTPWGRNPSALVCNSSKRVGTTVSSPLKWTSRKGARSLFEWFVPHSDLQRPSRSPISSREVESETYYLTAIHESAFHCCVVGAAGAASRAAADNKYDVVLSSGFLAFANHSGFLQAVDEVRPAAGASYSQCMPP
jgi:hypothetical protein